jgi:hypothetical protein
MSQEDSASADPTKLKVVYQIPGMESLPIQRTEYPAADGGVLKMDLYYPPEWKPGDQTPAVIIVVGYPEKGANFGLRDLAPSVSWAKLIAASGLVAITYRNREPAEDCRALLEHVRENAAALGIDGTRVGVSSASGNVPVALSLLMRAEGFALKCAVLSCGYLLDLDGSTIVAEAAKQYGFVNACVGKTVDDLPKDLPVFLARAGRDQFAHINEVTDRFVAHALGRNLPVTLVNFAEAPHGFELLLDSEASREVIRQMLGFMRFHLLAQ